MMLIYRLGMLLCLWAWSVGVASGASLKVEGIVVNEKAQPITDVVVASSWIARGDTGLKPNRVSKSDAVGHFSLEVERDDVDTALLAIDPSGQTGGLAVVDVRQPKKLLRIKVGPLIHVSGHFTCEELKQRPSETGVWIGFPATNQALLTTFSSGGDFSLKLPPGEYRWIGHGRPDDYQQVMKTIEVRRDKPLDMGAVDLKPTTIATFYGKTPPDLRITSARGIRSGVRLSDLRGKWVVIDFWGFWCGPCVSRSLPAWVDFWDDHSGDRDAFEILAFHDPQAKSLEEMDEKLKSTVKRLWGGRELPFPVLLDSTGETVANYGIAKWPTSLVIDPQGLLVRLPVGINADEFLASKLPPLSESKRIARGLDRYLGLSIADDMTLAEQIAFLQLVGRVKIAINPEVLQSVADPAKTVPVSLRGRLTLRAWLNLTLRPFPLTYVREGESLRIVPKKDGNDQLARPSSRQIADNEIVAEALKKEVPFDFHDEPLEKVMALLQSKTQESFAIDPAMRASGSITPKTTVTGRSDGRSLDQALGDLLKPQGLTFVIENEMVLITRRP